MLAESENQLERLKAVGDFDRTSLTHRRSYLELFLEVAEALESLLVLMGRSPMLPFPCEVGVGFDDDC